MSKETVWNASNPKRKRHAAKSTIEKIAELDPMYNNAGFGVIVHPEPETHSYFCACPKCGNVHTTTKEKLRP